MSEIKRIGVLMGGGDAPGLNPALKVLVYRASEHNIAVVGLYDGWRSLPTIARPHLSSPR